MLRKDFEEGRAAVILENPNDVKYFHHFLDSSTKISVTHRQRTPHVCVGNIVRYCTYERKLMHIAIYEKGYYSSGFRDLHGNYRCIKELPLRTLRL